MINLVYTMQWMLQIKKFEIFIFIFPFPRFCSFITQKQRIHFCGKKIDNWINLRGMPVFIIF